MVKDFRFRAGRLFLRVETGGKGAFPQGWGLEGRCFSAGLRLGRKVLLLRFGAGWEGAFPQGGGWAGRGFSSGLGLQGKGLFLRVGAAV